MFWGKTLGLNWFHEIEENSNFTWKLFFKLLIYLFSLCYDNASVSIVIIYNYLKLQRKHKNCKDKLKSVFFIHIQGRWNNLVGCGSCHIKICSLVAAEALGELVKSSQICILRGAHNRVWSKKTGQAQNSVNKTQVW